MRLFKQQTSGSLSDYSKTQSKISMPPPQTFKRKQEQTESCPRPNTTTNHLLFCQTGSTQQQHSGGRGEGGVKSLYHFTCVLGIIAP